jgi:hypothetical protein
MHVSQINGLTFVKDVDPGSLVLIPDNNGNGNQWAIRTDDKKLFQLKEVRLSSANSIIADFGKNYRVTFEPDTCRRFASPWFADGRPKGSLCLLPKNGGISTSIIIFWHPEEGVKILDLKTGEMPQQTSLDREGISFHRWGIELQCASADEPPNYELVYQFPVNAKK